MTAISNLNLRRFARQLECSAIAIALITGCSQHGMAQNSPSHMSESHMSDPATDARGLSGALLKIVRESTARFRDVSVAISEGYALQFGCVTGSDAGAMGLHYVNSALVSSGVLDATRPQIVIYEPIPGGGLRLIGADYLLIADAWNATHPNPPELMGQLFHLFDAPNRFGLPAFYTLHVWAWKENPNGAFVNWHPSVSCQSFAGQTGQ